MLVYKDIQGGRCFLRRVTNNSQTPFVMRSTYTGAIAYIPPGIFRCRFLINKEISESDGLGIQGLLAASRKSEQLGRSYPTITSPLFGRPFIRQQGRRGHYGMSIRSSERKRGHTCKESALLFR